MKHLKEFFIGIILVASTATFAEVPMPTPKDQDAYNKAPSIPPTKEERSQFKQFYIKAMQNYRKVHDDVDWGEEFKKYHELIDAEKKCVDEAKYMKDVIVCGDIDEITRQANKEFMAAGIKMLQGLKQMQQK